MEITSAFLKPQGNVARYFDSAFLLFSCISMALVYYSINYEICIENKCNNLVVTKYWASSSVFYLLLSGSLLVTSVYIFKNKELPRLYSFAIAIGFGSACILSGMLLFGILREINLNT